MKQLFKNVNNISGLKTECFHIVLKHFLFCHMVSVKLRSSSTDTLQTLIYWMSLHIECSLTLFLSLTLHSIFSCLMKSNNDRISMPRQPVKSLSVKDTKQGPILIKKKIKIKVSNK